MQRSRGLPRLCQFLMEYKVLRALGSGRSVYRQRSISPDVVPVGPFRSGAQRTAHRRVIGSRVSSVYKRKSRGGPRLVRPLWSVRY